MANSFCLSLRSSQLFYQLALARFGGGAGKGGLGKGIEVQPCILQALCASDGVDGVEVEEELREADAPLRDLERQPRVAALPPGMGCLAASCTLPART